MEITENLNKRLKAALEEDRAHEDITSRLLIPEKTRGKAEMIAQEEGILCGLDVARRCFQLMDSNIDFKTDYRDGERVKPGDVIARIQGPMRMMLGGERLALNLLCRLSGISTLTFRFAELAKPLNVRIYDTRKTTPLWRDLEKYAVRRGGGYNHRFSLAGACFIKDNHIDSCGGLKNALESLAAAEEIDVPVIVEARTREEVEIAASYSVDVILLDNMPPSLISDICRNTVTEAEFEVSGGITLENIRDYASTGVSRISVGTLTHSLKALDISMKHLTQ